MNHHPVLVGEDAPEPLAEWPTAPDPVPEARTRRARSLRRACVTLLAVFVGLGALNVFGSKTATVSASAGGYELSVTHPAVARSSLPVEWRLTLRHRGGFHGPIRIGISIAYFQMLDFNNWHPQPSSARDRGAMLVLSFAPPQGDTFTLLLDAAAQAGLTSGQRAVTAVLSKQGVPIVEVEYDTRVMP